MRIIVLVKDIPDLTEIKIDPITREPNLIGVKRRINELDKRGIEAAIQLREKHGGEVITLSVGDEVTETAILRALAMGADESFIIKDPRLGWLDSLTTSRLLEAALRKIGDYDIIVSGEMSLDTLASQVGPRLAELLDLPLITYVKEMIIDGDTVRAVRDLEAADIVVETNFPVLVTVVREISEPRIPSLLNIMKAKKKPMKHWTLSDIDLNIDEINRLSTIDVIKVQIPKVERKKIVLKADTIEELAERFVEAIEMEGIVEK